ncbi:MAG: prolipoprotein diacylglyceryl transferase family protein, partial [Thermodesulfobacteriota bacterium]
MYPILFSIGPFTVHTYGVMLALGAALGLWLLGRLARRAGLDADRVSSLALWLLLSGLLG